MSVHKQVYVGPYIKVDPKVEENLPEFFEDIFGDRDQFFVTNGCILPNNPRQGGKHIPNDYEEGGEFPMPQNFPMPENSFQPDDWKKLVMRLYRAEVQYEFKYGIVVFYL